MSGQPIIETIAVQNDPFIERIEQRVHEGNVRRIKIKQGAQTVAEFPLKRGVVGTIATPILAAINTLATALTDCKIEIEQESTMPVFEPEPELLVIDWIGVTFDLEAAY